jgi:hypothetical protein
MVWFGSFLTATRLQSFPLENSPQKGWKFRKDLITPGILPGNTRDGETKQSKKQEQKQARASSFLVTFLQAFTVSSPSSTRQLVNSSTRQFDNQIDGRSRKIIDRL